jgi:hypothetical protein
MKLKKNLIAISSFITIIILVLSTSIYPSLNRRQTPTIENANDESILVADLVGISIELEVAVSINKLAKGLMQVESIENNKGMLFIFQEEQKLTFWMKDTPVSLDIIYLNRNFEVVNIHENTLPNQTSVVYPSEQDAKYVIELKAGWSRKNALKIGDKLENITHL